MRHVDHEARTEDLEWMASTGENFDGAARRLGISIKSLEKWCLRQGRRDLVTALQRNERGAA